LGTKRKKENAKKIKDERKNTHILHTHTHTHTHIIEVAEP
jgi:hypothetical protein